jgi:hypothetical protein
MTRCRFDLIPLATTMQFIIYIANPVNILKNKNKIAILPLN